MDKIYISPLDFAGSDSSRIQAAVNEAVKTDLRVVVIPKKDTPWILDETVLLPGDVTVVLDGATVQSAGIVFQNTNADDLSTKALGGEQYEIYIIGTRGATLVGSGDAPQIYLSNVKGYRIAGLTFQGGGGLKLHYARYGKVQKLRFAGCRYGISLSEGCNNNIIEDIDADTQAEAITFRGADTPMFGRGKEMAETIVCRVQAKASPAVSIFPGPCDTYNLMLRDITAGGDGVLLGCPEDTKSIIDITLRNIDAQGFGVKTQGSCDGVYIANAGKTAFEAEATRCFTDDVTENIALPQLEEAPQKDFITPNDPAFFGSTDAQTVQNALHAAVAADKMLLIPRYNARTNTTVWNIEKAIILPSNAHIGLLKTHLRQQDFCYDNMFRAEHAEKVVITGVGDAILDGGIHNQLKSRNAEKYGMQIEQNACILLTDVKNAVFEHFQFKQTRWFALCATFCENVKVSGVVFTNYPLWPELGGLMLRSGCKNILAENLSGITGEDLVYVKALATDGTLDSKDVNIQNIHVRNTSVNVTRCTVVRLVAHDGRKISNVLAESLLDPSLPEEKKLPWAAVAVGSSLLHTQTPGACEDLTDIVIRDVYSRGDRIGELGGCSQNVTFTNLHGFGSCDYILQTRLWADSRNLRGNALYFRCIQGSRYMRGTATSNITDPKKYIGHSVFFENFHSKDAVLENVFVTINGEGFKLTGGGQLEVKNLQMGQCGRALSLCSTDSKLILNGEVQPTTAYRTL